MHTVPWSTAPWMDSLHRYLQHIKWKIVLANPWKLRPQQQNDVEIMEDIWELHLPKAKALQINSVQTYLKITFLSEITDHSGLTLLPQALSPQKPNNSFFHSKPNQSTLSWPTQLCCPWKITGKQWQEVILWMYAQPNTTTLLKPLGPWSQQYNQDYEWMWTVNPRMHQLFHWYNNGWHTYQPKWWQTTEIIYPLQPWIIQVAPTNTIPATPQLLHNHIHLSLLIHQITPKSMTPILPQQTLIHKLTEPPDNWEGPLWAQITQRHKLDSWNWAYPSERT